MATADYQKHIDELIHTLNQYGLDEVMFEVGSRINNVTDPIKNAEIKTLKGRFHFFANNIVEELKIPNKYKIDSLKVATVGKNLISGQQGCGSSGFSSRESNLNPVISLIKRIQDKVLEIEKL
jgi:hypothetical protein